MSAGRDGDIVTVGMLRDSERAILGRLTRLEEELGPKQDHSPHDLAEYGMGRSDSADPWVHRSAGMSCATCMWFVRKEKSGPQPPSARAVGRCRRHAPTMAGYPVVFEADWCGDHKLDENKA